MATTSGPISSKVKRRWWIPLSTLILGAAVLALAQLWDWYEWQAEFLMPLFMAAMALLFGGLFVVVPLWWWFSSGFSKTTRLIGLALFVGSLAGAIAVTRKVEMLPLARIGLYPRFTFIWDVDPEARRIEHARRQQQLKEDLPDLDLTVAADDFPRYRGFHIDGVIPALTLNPDWNLHPPKLLWKHPCGGGYAAFAVAGNVAVTLEQHGPDEAVVVCDRATGRQRWTYAYPALHKDIMGDGPRSTPLIDKGDIFTLGATGELLCLDPKAKIKKWGVNILQDNQAKNIKWALAGSPLLVGDLIVVNAGIDPANPVAASLVAYDRAKGTKVWAANQRKAAYSSPQLATLAGMTQILLFDGEGLAGFDPTDGRELWSYPWETAWDMNMIQPLVIGDDRVLISSERVNGCVLLRIARNADAWTATPIWKNRNLAARYANPVTDGQHIFGLHKQNGMLVCLDPDTGQQLWTGAEYGPGQMLLVGKHLLIQSGDGELCLVDADPKQFREHARFRVFDDKTWNTPALAGRRLYMRNESEMACVELP